MSTPDRTHDESREIALIISCLISINNELKTVEKSARDQKDRATFVATKNAVRNLNKALILLGKTPPESYAEAMVSIADFPECGKEEYEEAPPVVNREWLIYEWIK